MYGIVNKGIEELIKARFSEEKWNAILLRSGVGIDFFIGSESYDDDITFKIATAVSEEMNMSIDQVLIEFGKWWVLVTGLEKYNGLMKAGGKTLHEFILNLPNFHDRIVLIYPKLTPPEFRVTNASSAGLHLHYYSKRKGLQSFVYGLLLGLSTMFETEIKIELVASREWGNDHDEFKIEYA